MSRDPFRCSGAPVSIDTPELPEQLRMFRKAENGTDRNIGTADLSQRSCGPQGVATVATTATAADVTTASSVADWGDMRPCVWCLRLTPDGLCLAAGRGEIRAHTAYVPTFPRQPRRCIGYQPRSVDPDRRPGRERWPELVSWQAPASLPGG